MIKDSSKLLIISAHPDDEVLGCGGLIAKYSSIIPIKILLIAEGSTCRFEEINSKKAILAIEERHSFFKESCKILGVKDFEAHQLRCGCLSSLPIININRLIEKSIEEYKPTHIFTHYNFDNNNDHRIVSRATDMATRPKSGSSIEALLHYEVQSSTDWNFSNAQFQPNFFLGLSEDNLKLKLKAMSAYFSEYKDGIASRSSEGLRVLAKYRGIQSGFNFAEAYRLIRANI